MLDVGQAHHAVEQRYRMLVRQRGTGEVDEFGVDVVRRNRGADPVEPGLGHHWAFPDSGTGICPASAHTRDVGLARHCATMLS